MRIYIIPVKYACNADCTFCITEIEKVKPGFEAMQGTLKIDEKLRNQLQKCKEYGVNEVEVSGGGEPYLHKDLDKLIEMVREEIPGSYIKVYTNGMRYRPIYIDEINVSRAHYDSSINNEIYRTKEQNDLETTFEYFRQYCKVLRWKLPLMKEAIDSTEKILEMVNKFPMLDKIIPTPLFDKVPLAKDRYVGFEELNTAVLSENKKIKLDRTGDYCGMQPIIAADGELYENWDFANKFKEENLTQWSGFNRETIAKKL